MAHSLFMHYTQRLQDFIGNMFKNRFRHCSNTLHEVSKTSICGIVLDNRNTSLRTIPMGLVNSYETIRYSLFISMKAVMLPVCDPIVQHLPYLNICNWNFFYCVDFERWSMEHLLYCARGAFEYSKRYHLF